MKAGTRRFSCAEVSESFDSSQIHAPDMFVIGNIPNLSCDRDLGLPRTGTLLFVSEMSYVVNLVDVPP